MRVELLPSCVPAGDPQFLVSFLVNEEIAIDAGAVGLLADLARQQRIRHIFLTHEHLDHIASLPILLENTYQPGSRPVELLAAGDMLDLLHRDFFNGRVWPDFFELSDGDDRFLTCTRLEPLQGVERSGLVVTPVPVSHAVDTLGFLVDDGRSAVAFPSDTGPTEAIWDVLRSCDHLRAVFLETSFPSRLRELADECGHLCPETFVGERKKLARSVRWIIVHRKAAFADEIAEEFAALDLADVEMVVPGRVYDF